MSLLANFRDARKSLRDQNKRKRRRQSLYLDRGVIQRIDQVLDSLPRTVGKSALLEELLEYGLDNLDEVKQRITKTAM